MSSARDSRARAGANPVALLVRRRYVAVSPLASLFETLQLMRLGRLRQVPVVHDGILVGLLGFPELIAATLLAREAGNPDPAIADVLIDRAEPARLETSLSEAASRMARGALGFLPVVEPSERGPRLVGVVTEADLLRAAYAPGLAAGAP